MTLANLKGFECLVDDFVNTEQRDLERGEGERERGETQQRGEGGKKGRGADIKIPRVV